MSILDRVTSTLPNLFGKGPLGLPTPHNMSWGISHDRAHGGEGPRGFPGAPGAGGGVSNGMQQGGFGIGHGLARPPGLPGPPGPPGMPGPPGLANVDRPNGAGWSQGPERPGAQPPVGTGLDRPGSGPVSGHGVDRPQLPGPGQLVRDLVGVPRQPVSTVQVVQVPGQANPSQQASALATQAQPGVSTALPGQAAAQGHAAQQPPVQMPAGPRAEAAMLSPQRGDAVPQATPGAAAMRADAGAAPRPVDAALPGMQRIATPAASTSAPGTATTVAANSPAGAAGSTAATVASALAASATAAALTAPASASVAGHTGAAAPAAAAQVADARNVHNPMAVNDRGTPPRPDAAGYTGGGPQRGGPGRNIRAASGGLSTLLMALGAQGNTGASGRDPASVERELREAMMQWLFWLLAVVAYGCLGFAIVALLPVGSQALGETSRTWTGGSALVGLFTAVAAWWIARKLGSRRG